MASPLESMPLHGRRGPLMFYLSAAFLLVVGGVLHRHTEIDLSNIELRIQLGFLAVLWPVFLVEACLRFAERDRSRGAVMPLLQVVAIVLFPPNRLAVRDPTIGGQVWLPRVGWQNVDRYLRMKVEKAISVPMIVIALLILPVLAIEFGWPSLVEESFGLQLSLAIASSVIWFAFALEFLVLFALAESKWRYCMTNWISLLIVVLPLVQFLPLVRLLRLGRLLRLEQLTRMGRVYRMRGLLFRAWRAVLLLELIQKLFGRSLEKRLAELVKLLEAKKEEISDVTREIEEVREMIRRRDAKADAAEADSSARPGEPSASCRVEAEAVTPVVAAAPSDSR